MSAKIFIGNLPFTLTEEDIGKLISRYSEVDSVRLVTDSDSASRGFGFAEVSDPENVIEKLDDEEFQGHNLVVKYAIDRGSW